MVATAAPEKRGAEQVRGVRTHGGGTEGPKAARGLSPVLPPENQPPNILKHFENEPLTKYGDAVK